MQARKTISLVVLLLVLCTFGGIIYTNAKYTTTVSKDVSTSVAKYVFNLTGSDSYDLNDTIENLMLAQSCDETTLVDGKIAPGTSGSLDLVVDCTGAEVGIEYQLTFKNNSSKSLPANLKLTLDGKDWNFDQAISGKIYANGTKTETHNIAWNWDYQTVNGDEADTLDGQNAFDYSFTVEAVGTQMTPIVEL